jgi:hypothetical protein
MHNGPVGARKTRGATGSRRVDVDGAGTLARTCARTRDVEGSDGTVRSAQETVKHIARVSVASRRGTLKILTTEISDLGPVVLSA